MPAIKELFSGGKGMSLDDLIAKLNKVWEAAKSAVAKLGGQIANMIIDFLMKDSAEEEIGDAIGYLVGMIAFQAVLDAFTVGAWSEVSVVLTAIAKFLNWPMKFLGEAMGLMKKLGGFILDGLKSLGKMVAEAGAGALREVTGALRQIAGKLGEFADEILAKFGGKGATTAENTAAHTLEGDAAKTLERDAASTAERDAAKGKPGERKPGETKPSEASVAEKEAQKAEEFGEAMAISKIILHGEDAGHIPGPAIAVSLDGLKARYSWIKAFEARPHGHGYTVYMIASENRVDDTGQNDAEPPWEKPKGWRLPKDGTWSGTVGDSVFKPNNPEALGLRPGDTIQYRRGVPDFSPWKVGEDLKVPGMTGVHADDMPLIYQALADSRPDLANATQARNWLSANGLTPHHAGGDTVQLIPTRLHGGIRHTGGAFELRGGG
jgi:hypothetical protein